MSTTATLDPRAAGLAPSFGERLKGDPVYQSFTLLRVAFTVAPILFGLDKSFGVMVDWEQYLAPWINDIVPGGATAMHLVGAIEIVAGIAVALKPRYGAYLVAAWLAGIILNLLTYSGYYDIALRDFGLMLGALTLARLASVYDPPGFEVRLKGWTEPRLGGMPPLLERLGVELPVVQAGMGGGLSRHELAAAVSEAGGLGTIAVAGAGAIRRELAAARALTGKPLAVNVLLPFARRDWFEAAAAADVVVTFWGKPRRRTPGAWLHQCGSIAEARRAQDAGADGVIVQGVEAGGHVRGATPALQLLEEASAALPAGYPLLLAGGIAEPGDVQEALAAGATAAVAGTRFLLSEESRAHALYKERLLAAEETFLTELFGAGWPAPHRVVPNAATERWLGRRSSLVPHKDHQGRTPSLLRGPLPNRLLNHLLAPGIRYAPSSLQQRMIRAQRPGGRVLTPAGPTDDGPPNLVEAGALYAGETVARIDTVRPAAELVRELASVRSTARQRVGTSIPAEAIRRRPSPS